METYLGAPLIFNEYQDIFRNERETHEKYSEEDLSEEEENLDIIPETSEDNEKSERIGQKGSEINNMDLLIFPPQDFLHERIGQGHLSKNVVLEKERVKKKNERIDSEWDKTLAKREELLEKANKEIPSQKTKKKFAVVDEDRKKDKESLLLELQELKKQHHEDINEIKFLKVKIEKLEKVKIKTKPPPQSKEVHNELNEVKKQLLNEKKTTQVLQKKLQIYEAQRLHPIRPESAKIANTEASPAEKSEKVSTLRVSMSKMKDEITALKKQLNQKIEEIAKLKEKTSLTQNKKLEAEIARLKPYEQNYALMQASDKALKEQEIPEGERKDMVRAQILGTLSAWNSCPSYMKKHMDKQDANIKSLQIKISQLENEKEELQKALLEKSLSQKHIPIPKSDPEISKLKKRIEELTIQNSDQNLQISKLKLILQPKQFLF